jgi:hypothetical protein
MRQGHGLGLPSNQVFMIPQISEDSVNVLPTTVFPADRVPAPAEIV